MPPNDYSNALQLRYGGEYRNGGNISMIASAEVWAYTKDNVYINRPKTIDETYIYSQIDQSNYLKSKFIIIDLS